MEYNNYIELLYDQADFKLYWPTTIMLWAHNYNTPCGIIDTVKILLNNYDCDNHSLLQMLLKSY